MLRRTLLLTPFLATPALGPALAQGFPSRPVRLVVPFAAGGIIDVVARILAEPLARRLGQPVVVENLPGAGSSIGARAVARAAPDGHTLLLSGAAHAVIGHAVPGPRLRPAGGFRPGGAARGPALRRRGASRRAGDRRAGPAGLAAGEGGRCANFATTGIGAASHLAGELLKSLAGVDFTVVTYRGTPQAVTDLVAGRADLMIDSQTLLAPMARDGRVRALAVTTAQRSRLLPELPTLAEAGVPGYAASSWQSLQAPAGTPPAILAQLADRRGGQPGGAGGRRRATPRRGSSRWSATRRRRRGSSGRRAPNGRRSCRQAGSGRGSACIWASIRTYFGTEFADDPGVLYRASPEPCPLHG